MADPTRPPRKERSLRVLAWATLPVTLLGVWVQTTGVGIDLLVIAVGAVLLLAMERTLGDWLGELLGSALAGIVFAIFIAGLVLYFVADAEGKSRARRFFDNAQQRGYTTVYFFTPLPENPDATGHSASATVAPLATTGVTRTNSVSHPTRGDAFRSTPRAPEVTGAPSSRGSTQRRSRLLWFDSVRPLPADTIISFSISSESVAPGERVTLRAEVASRGVAVTTGNVEFSVGGLGAGRIPLSAAGTAATTYLTHIPGTYEIQARYPGALAFAPSLSPSLTLTVRKGR